MTDPDPRVTEALALIHASLDKQSLYLLSQALAAVRTHGWGSVAVEIHEGAVVSVRPSLSLKPGKACTILWRSIDD